MTRIDRDAVTADFLLEAGYTPDEVRRMIQAGRGGVRWLMMPFRRAIRPPLPFRSFNAPVEMWREAEMWRETTIRSEKITPGWVDRDAHPDIPDSHFDLDRSPPGPGEGPFRREYLGTWKTD